MSMIGPKIAETAGRLIAHKKDTIANTAAQTGRIASGAAKGTTKAIMALPMLREGIDKATGRDQTRSIVQRHQPPSAATRDAITAIDARTDSILSAPQSGAAQFWADASNAIGEMLPTIATSAATGGGSLVGTGVSQAVGGAIAYSSEYIESGELYPSLVAAGAEVISEKIGGKLFNGPADKMADSITNKAASGAVKWSANALGEGAEEVISGGLQALLTGKPYGLDQASREFALGATVGGVVGGVEVGANVTAGGITEGRVQNAVQKHISGATNADVNDVQSLVSSGNDSTAVAVTAQDSATPSDAGQTRGEMIWSPLSEQSVNEDMRRAFDTPNGSPAVVALPHVDSADIRATPDAPAAPDKPDAPTQSPDQNSANDTDGNTHAFDWQGFTPSDGGQAEVGPKKSGVITIDAPTDIGVREVPELPTRERTDANSEAIQRNPRDITAPYEVETVNERETPLPAEFTETPTIEINLPSGDVIEIPDLSKIINVNAQPDLSVNNTPDNVPEYISEVSPEATEMEMPPEESVETPLTVPLPVDTNAEPILDPNPVYYNDYDFDMPDFTRHIQEEVIPKILEGAPTNTDMATEQSESAAIESNSTNSDSKLDAALQSTETAFYSVEASRANANSLSNAKQSRYTTETAGDSSDSVENVETETQSSVQTQTNIRPQSLTQVQSLTRAQTQSLTQTRTEMETQTQTQTQTETQTQSAQQIWAPTQVKAETNTRKRENKERQSNDFSIVKGPGSRGAIHETAGYNTTFGGLSSY